MRTAFLVAWTATILTAAAACASSQEGDSAPSSSPPETGTVPESDAETADVSESSVDVAIPTCSAAGWCVTTLPDVDLVLRDVSPREGRAFAIAESATLGVKVLEWTDSEAAWHYIDDNSQNQVGGQYAGTIWAPSDDELYYGVAPNYIYHGTRQAPPNAGWTWSAHPLADNSHVGEPNHETDDHGIARNNETGFLSPTLGVWGTATDDVYAWYANTIYHAKNESGVLTWIADYIANDADSSDEHLFFLSAAGSNSDDVWFSGGRATSDNDCPLVVHKTSTEYSRIVDSVQPGDYSCSPRGAMAFLGETRGWVSDIQSRGADGILGLQGAYDIAEIAISAGEPSVAISSIPIFTSIGGSWSGYSSVWASSREVWVAGWGLVLRGSDFADADSYAISTLSLNGAPLDASIFRVRGTSPTNLWAIGNGHAMHKTTP